MTRESIERVWSFVSRNKENLERLRDILLVSVMSLLFVSFLTRNVLISIVCTALSFLLVATSVLILQIRQSRNVSISEN